MSTLRLPWSSINQVYYDMILCCYDEEYECWMGIECSQVKCSVVRCSKVGRRNKTYRWTICHICITNSSNFESIIRNYFCVPCFLTTPNIFVITWWLNYWIDENMEEFQDTLTRCARLEVRKKAAFMREARLVAKHEYERKQLQLAQDSMYKVCVVLCGVV